MENPKSQKPNIDWKGMKAAEKRAGGRDARRLEGELEKAGGSGFFSMLGEMKEARLREEMESFQTMEKNWQEKAQARQQWLETTLEKMPGLKDPEQIRKEVNQEVEAYLAKARRAHLEARARELRLAGTDTYEKRKRSQILERSWKKLTAPFQELTEIYEQAINDVQESLRAAEREAIAARDRALEAEATIDGCREELKSRGNTVGRFFRRVLGQDRGLWSLIDQAENQLRLFERQAKKWEKFAAGLRETLIKIEFRKNQKEEILRSYKNRYEDKIKNFGASSQEESSAAAENDTGASGESFSLEELGAAKSFAEERPAGEATSIVAEPVLPAEEKPESGPAEKKEEAKEGERKLETVGDYLGAWNNLWRDRPELVFDLEAPALKAKNILDRKVGDKEMRKAFIDLVEEKFVKSGLMAPWISEALEQALPAAIFGKRLNILGWALEKRPRPRYLGPEKKTALEPEEEKEAPKPERPKRVEAHILKNMKEHLLAWNKRYPRLALASLDFPSEVLKNMEKGIKPNDAKNLLIGSLDIVFVKRGLAKPELLEIMRSLSLGDILNGAREADINAAVIDFSESEDEKKNPERKSRAKMLEMNKEKTAALGKNIDAFVELLEKRKEAGLNPYIKDEELAELKTNARWFLELETNVGVSDFNKKLRAFTGALEKIGKSLGAFKQDDAESLQLVCDAFKSVESGFVDVAASIAEEQKTKLVQSGLNKVGRLLARKRDFLCTLQELKK